MGTSYLTYGAWDYVQKSAADWNDDALADALGEGAGAEVPLVLALLGGGPGEGRIGRRGSGRA